MSSRGSGWNQPPPHPLVHLQPEHPHQSKARSHSQHPKRRALHIAGNSQSLSLEPTDELATIVRHCHCRPALLPVPREREGVSSGSLSLYTYRLPSTPIVQCESCRDRCRRCWRQINRDKGIKPTIRSRARRNRWISTKTELLTTTTGPEQSSHLGTGLIEVKFEQGCCISKDVQLTEQQQITSQDPLSARSCRLRPTRARPPSARRNFHVVEGAVSAAATDCSFQRLHQRHHQPTFTRRLKQPP